MSTEFSFADLLLRVLPWAIPLFCVYLLTMFFALVGVLIRKPKNWKLWAVLAVCLPLIGAGIAFWQSRKKA